MLNLGLGIYAETIVRVAAEIANWRRQGKTDKWITEYLLFPPSEGQETVAAAFEYAATGKLPASAAPPSKGWLTAKHVAIGGVALVAASAAIATAVFLSKRKQAASGIAGARSKKPALPEPAPTADKRQWYLETIRDDFVVWGYGPGGSVEHVERAEPWIEMAPGLKMSFPFELPSPHKGSSLPAPREYRRVRSLAWRWNFGDGTHGTSWRLAPTQKAAVADARASLEHQSFHTQEIFKRALQDVRRVTPTPPPKKGEKW